MVNSMYFENKMDVIISKNSTFNNEKLKKKIRLSIMRKSKFLHIKKPGRPPKKLTKYLLQNIYAFIIKRN